MTLTDAELAELKVAANRSNAIYANPETCKAINSLVDELTALREQQKANSETVRIAKAVINQMKESAPQQPATAGEEQPWYTEQDGQTLLGGFTACEVEATWLVEQLNLAFNKGKQIGAGSLTSDIEQRLAEIRERESKGNKGTLDVRDFMG